MIDFLFDLIVMWVMLSLILGPLLLMMHWWKRSNDNHFIGSIQDRHWAVCQERDDLRHRLAEMTRDLNSAQAANRFLLEEMDR